MASRRHHITVPDYVSDGTIREILEQLPFNIDNIVVQGAMDGLRYVGFTVPLEVPPDAEAREAFRQRLLNDIREMVQGG